MRIGFIGGGTMAEAILPDFLTPGGTAGTNSTHQGAVSPYV